MKEFRPGRFEVLPMVIKNLLIINGLFFLAQNTIGNQFSFDDWFALHAWKSPLFKPWQLVTHMFLHGDVGHIFGNMFALWMFGSILESLWGGKRFLTFYLICGLGAALLHLLFLNYDISNLNSQYIQIASMHVNHQAGSIQAMLAFADYHHVSGDLVEYLRNSPDDVAASDKLMETLSAYYTSILNTPTIGASGAIFGVLAAFVYLFPNTYLYLYFFVPVKAKWAGLAYFAYELFFAVKNSAGDNVARWAHVGGAIVGLLIVITWNKTNKKTFY
ncbi:rhomboid family intramembrane serine protease [Parasediminibacterium sp. JCM 36343]|uniref:rhomboid family intramembrane serine protease n=1 Tax=Parasediminibacterium sp. JCM 36343 TaxID=3374279 RepID=UPI003979FC08